MFGFIGSVISAPLKIASYAVEETFDVVGLKPVAQVATMPLRVTGAVAESVGDATDEWLEDTLDI